MTRPTMTGPQSITPDRMESLAFQSGVPIELDGDLMHLTLNGQQYVAVQRGWWVAVVIPTTGKRSRLRCLCEGCETVRLSERRPYQPRHRAEVLTRGPS